MTQLTTIPAPAKQSGVTWKIAADLHPMCVRALRRMYDPEINLFCHCIRRGPEGDVPEGVSHRYTAITLIGLHSQQRDLLGMVLGAEHVEATYERLAEDALHMKSVGDVALTLWACSADGKTYAADMLECLRRFDPANRPYPTVELAWALTALSINPSHCTDKELAKSLAARLMHLFNAEACLFPHWVGPAQAPAWRRHVSCFADWVYPVQALAHYHMAFNAPDALAVARRSTDRMLGLQGDGGQWWWHYDVRTGRVVEQYPVYSVHQDAMGPMALFAVEDASGEKFDAAIQKSLDWLLKSPERGDSVIDHQADLIWRKVCRREPGKLVRGLQAMASYLSPSMRTPLVKSLFPPTEIDYECRPYHLGWLLHAFSDRRTGTANASLELS